MKLSVVITAFNHERFIGQAIEGVLMQETDFDFELVVGDDGSTDGTRRIIESYAESFPERMTTVFPERNLGDDGKRLFDKVVTSSRGRYVAWLDGDDYWTSRHKLRAQVALLDDHAEVAMCFHDARMVSFPSEEDLGSFTPADTPDRVSIERFLTHSRAAACSPVFRREVLDPLPPWYFSLQFGDWPLYLRAALMGEVAFLPDVMGVYRIHGAGMWSGLGETPERRRLLAEFYANMLAALELERHPIAREWLSVQRHRVARDMARAGDWSGARRFAIRALQVRSWKADRLLLDMLKMAVQPRLAGARTRTGGRS